MSFRQFGATILFFFLFIAGAGAGTIDDLLQKGGGGRKEFKDFDAITYYKQVLAIDSNNFQALWNISYTFQRTGWIEQDKTVKKQLYDSALFYGKKLYGKYPGT